MPDDLEGGNKINSEGEQDPETFIAPITSYAKPIEQKVEEVQSNTNEPAIEQNEFVLTPEIEEKIMEKVQDIDKEGTAFSSITFAQDHSEQNIQERLKSILKSGLLGTPLAAQFTGKENFNHQWRSRARARDVQNCLIWFNIVGRIKSINSPNQIEKSLITGDTAIIFVAKHLKELPRGIYLDMVAERPKRKIIGSFAAAQKDYGYYYQILTEKIFPKKNKYQFKVSESWGFVTPFRIRPHYFQGIVISKNKVPFLANYITSEIEVNNNKENYLIPIYNTHGDLLWPRQMSYEEVKQFVAERDAKKKEEVKKSGNETDLETEA